MVIVYSTLTDEAKAVVDALEVVSVVGPNKLACLSFVKTEVEETERLLSNSKIALLNSETNSLIDYRERLNNASKTINANFI